MIKMYKVDNRICGNQTGRYYQLGIFVDRSGFKTGFLLFGLKDLHKVVISCDNVHPRDLVIIIPEYPLDHFLIHHKTALPACVMVITAV